MLCLKMGIMVSVRSSFSFRIFDKETIAVQRSIVDSLLINLIKTGMAPYPKLVILDTNTT